MQVNNPLVPPPVGSSSGAASAVANAPSAPESARHDTPRPVTGSRRSDRSRSEADRPHPDDGGSHRRGERVDIRV